MLDQEPFRSNKGSYIAYVVVMSFILTTGFLGNLLTILVLKEREHRRKNVTPLMINLAAADLFIILFGYPVQVHANVSWEPQINSHCNWRGFVNGVVGLTCIFTLTEMGMVTYRGLKCVDGAFNLSRRQVAFLICAAWLYGGICMLPPLLGWSKFVISASKLSCSPNWAGQTAADKAYTLLLVAFGFFLPLTAMTMSYYKILCVVRRQCVRGNDAVQLRQRNSKMKIIRMTVMSVAAMMLSWAPYCLVSLFSIVSGKPVIENWEAEIPELFAKASVVYNPIIYTIMNRSFRATLHRILRCRRCNVVVPEIPVIAKRYDVRPKAYHLPDNGVVLRAVRAPVIRMQSQESGRYIRATGQSTSSKANQSRIAAW
ncbi:pinopsin-like [Montipora foliosa]|uniref:pinopsin-like n=1 Tax=Montipora foliosa TaxID=591990 RepID=UPI0035F11B02